MPDILSINSAKLPDDAHVVSARGHEALSQLYHFEIGLLLDGTAALDEAIGERAVLQIDRDDQPPMRIHGVLTSLEYLYEWEGQALVKATLRPLLHRLTLTQHSRIYVDKTVIEIVGDRLQAGGLTEDDYSFKLSRDHAPFEHVCQYQESDYAFIARRLQREGLYFYFEQTDTRETLVITDDKAFHNTLRDGVVRYVPQLGGTSSGADAMARESLDTFRHQRKAVPAQVAFDDYDAVNPQLDLRVSAPIERGTFGDIHRFGANYLTQPDGKRLAQLSVEGYLSREQQYRGAGRVFGISAGHTFEVDEHPRAALNRRYLATAVRHIANQSAASPELRELLEIDSEDQYRIEVIAIDAECQYRAPAPRWPRIDGYELAVIDGAADSAYAQLDDHGRYKVKIKFDESDLDSGKASTWVRMLQAHGGGTEGMHFPLRKNTEVLLIFLGGDPDRPVIAGAIPNAHTPSPVAGGNKTRNVLISGDGNKLEMNDEQPWIDLFCPTEQSYLHLGHPDDEHDEHIVLNTGKDALFNYGTDWDIEVGGEKFEHVVLKVTQHFDNEHHHHVKSNQLYTVGGNRDRLVTGDETVVIESNRVVRVEGNHTLVTPKTTIIQAGDAYIQMETGIIRIGNGKGATIELKDGKATVMATENITLVTPEGSINFAAKTDIIAQATTIGSYAGETWVAVAGDPEGSPNSMGMTKDSWSVYSTDKATLVSAKETLVTSNVATTVSGGKTLALQTKELTATAETKIEAGSKEITIGAATTTVSADSKLSLAAQGVVEIQGALAKIN